MIVDVPSPLAAVARSASPEVRNFAGFVTPEKLWHAVEKPWKDIQATNYYWLSQAKQLVRNIFPSCQGLVATLAKGLQSFHLLHVRNQAWQHLP